MSETTIQLLWQNRRVHPEFRAGVSLHSHTMYSEESLQMVPRYTGKVPLLADAVRGASHQFKKGKEKSSIFPARSGRRLCRRGRPTAWNRSRYKIPSSCPRSSR